MKRNLFVFGCLLALFLLPRSNRALAHTQSLAAGVRVGHAGFFYNQLRSYGEWIEVDPGFYAWRPIRVGTGWRPYLQGRWTWTDYGWYWVSSEPFGWAVFHYGRWYFDDYYGWIWIPDDVWGPSWVEWRYNDDYIGWAPLPPYASFSISIGIRFTTRWVAPSHYWCFVRYPHFSAGHVNAYTFDEGFTRRLIHTTRTAVRYEVDRDRIVNRGVDRSYIERRGNTRIERTDVGETRDRMERIVRDGNRERIEVYRPSRTELDQREDRIEARKPDRRTSLDVERIERGRGTESRERETGTDQRSFDTERRILRERREPREENRDQSPPVKPDQRRESGTQQQRTTPDRRERRSEFRSSQPDRPTYQRQPERTPTPRYESQGGSRREGSSQSQPTRRDGQRRGR